MDDDVIADAFRRAAHYAAGIGARAPNPDAEAPGRLKAFNKVLPDRGCPAGETLALLDDVGSPATARTTRPRCFG